jgi:8-oxo-dGTP pyrophosphatase MutT (NUDIX family)
VDEFRRGGRCQGQALLSAFVPDLPFRHSCRGLLVAGDRILLAEHRIRGGSVWVGPGGGVEAGESLLDALIRELHEETGLQVTAAYAPQLVWVQTVEFPDMRAQGYAGVINHFFLIHVDVFVPASGVGVAAAGHPQGEGILDQRWWTTSEIEAAHNTGVLFSPRDLARLLHRLLHDGPPPVAITIGL